MSPFKLLNAKCFPAWQINAIGHYSLREEDKRELAASSGKTAGETLVDAVNMSERAVIGYAKDTGNVLALFGYSNIPVVKGRVIWMVATPEIYYYIKPFLSISKKIINYWLSKFEVLHGYIDTRNVKHIAWLKGLSFEFPKEMIVKLYNDVPFQYFLKEKTNV